MNEVGLYFCLFIGNYMFLNNKCPCKTFALSLLKGQLDRYYICQSSINVVGIDRTGHMSFLTGQDQTPKFAGQVLPDRTESGQISSNILPTKYGLSILMR